jgi:thiol-disulfide isomerase/thioredoxin
MTFMKRHNTWLSNLFAITAVLLFSVSVQLKAEDFDLSVTTSDIQLGKQVSGQQIDSTQLNNRVVMLEFWGVKCPPCLVSMPKLEQLHKELGPMGLLVVGIHAQGGPVEAIESSVQQLGVTFPIFENAGLAKGSDFTGIPHCMLFDHEGKCLYRGSPFQVESALRQAVANAPPMILEGRKLEVLTAFNEQLRSEAAFAPALRKARSLTDSKDAKTAEEASYVVKQLTGYGEKLLAMAKEGRDADPLGAVNTLKRLTTIYRGSDIGTEAADLQKAWKKDDEFQDALKGAEMLVQLQAAYETVLAATSSKEGNLSAETADSLPSPVKRKMGTMVKAILKTAPSSKSAERAKEIAAQLKLEIDS